MSHYRLFVFDVCKRGEHTGCAGETRNDTCICGCHAEWPDDEGALK